MGIIKQTIICVVIGLVFMTCEASDNKAITKVTNDVESIVLKDYSVSDIKQACVNTINNAKDIKDKTKNAIEYTEETMAKYREDVI